MASAAMSDSAADIHMDLMVHVENELTENEVSRIATNLHIAEIISFNIREKVGSNFQELNLQLGHLHPDLHGIGKYCLMQAHLERIGRRDLVNYIEKEQLRIRKLLTDKKPQKKSSSVSPAKEGVLFNDAVKKTQPFAHGKSDYKIDIAIVGEETVGKSSLAQRFVSDSFDAHTFSTIGVDFTVRTIYVDDKAVQIMLWDTAGQERFHAITHSYYRNMDGIIVVYDVTDMESFGNIQGWFKDVDNFAPENVSLMLVGNKTDLLTKRAVRSEAGKDLADRMRVAFFEVSAKDGTSVMAAFRTMARDIKEKIDSKQLASEEKIRNQSIRLAEDMVVKTGTHCCASIFRPRSS